METIKNRYILLDTNILVYCGDRGYGSDAKKLLRLLKDNGNHLATSEINCFELLKNAIDNKLKAYFLSLVNYIDRIQITKNHLENGCVLYHAYHKHFSGNCKMGSMDLVIAGTVIYQKDTLLLTANRKHFPEPFWKLVAQCHLMRKTDDGGDELVNIYLLKFNYSTVLSKEEIDE